MKNSLESRESREANMKWFKWSINNQFLQHMFWSFLIRRTIARMIAIVVAIMLITTTLTIIAAILLTIITIIKHPQLEVYCGYGPFGMGWCEMTPMFGAAVCRGSEVWGSQAGEDQKKNTLNTCEIITKNDPNLFAAALHRKVGAILKSVHIKCTNVSWQMISSHQPFISRLKSPAITSTKWPGNQHLLASCEALGWYIQWLRDPETRQNVGSYPPKWGSSFPLPK